MRMLSRTCLALGLVGIGYIVGVCTAVAPNAVQAQNDADSLSDDTKQSMAELRTAADSALVALQRDNRYVAAIEGMNAFAISVGGVNAISDLDSGLGVDPETFAGLYAGLAVDDVAKKLDRDGDGLLTYNGKLVQMYPVSRLKSLFAQRAADETAGDASK